MPTPVYRRVLLKLSGEALKNEASSILDFSYMDTVVEQIKYCVDSGVQVAIVIGAGNIWRGARGTDVNRTRADHMGMLATVINSIGMKDALVRAGLDAHVMTPVMMETFTEPYLCDKAVEYLEKGSVVVLAGGSGAPFFSTDTAAVLRAAEIGADVTLMAKNIDAIYTADPRKDPSAEPLRQVDYMHILENHLTAIDITATAFAMENKMPIHIFGLDNPENISRVIMGEQLGTIVKGGVQK
ncbi:MAG: UMP kinase [Clostridia bacterium]|nr:UMP kinase [Clostridia bacterium]